MWAGEDNYARLVYLYKGFPNQLANYICKPLAQHLLLFFQYLFFAQISVLIRQLGHLEEVRDPVAILLILR